MSNQEIENFAEKRADYKRVKTKMDRASRKAFLRRHFMWIVAITFTIAVVLVTTLVNNVNGVTPPDGMLNTLVLGAWVSLAYAYLAAIVSSVTGSATVLRFMGGAYFVALMSWAMWFITSN